jgi:hypothetical protein
VQQADILGSWAETVAREDHSRVNTGADKTGFRAMQSTRPSTGIMQSKALGGVVGEVSREGVGEPVTEMLLVGAGASKDAGLPDTFGLTDEVMRSVAESPNHRDRDVLSYLVGGLLYANGVAGGNPLQSGVDIEALFRAAIRLSRWQESDVAPFVAAWQPRFLQLAERSHNAESSFDQTPTNVFASAAVGLTRALGRILWKTTHETEYWSPVLQVLARQRRLVIATLNYDNVVETFLDRARIQCSTGIPRSTGYNVRKGYEFEEDVQEGVLLLKLHGSLNWAQYLHALSQDQKDDVCPHPFIIPWGDQTPNYAARMEILPAIVFGNENKLTADGPFLEIFIRFRDELRKSSRLTIVGYSFRDAHINAELTAFANQRPESRFCVIDPQPPMENPFFRDFHAALSKTRRIELVQKSAGAGFVELFGLTPKESSQPL